MRRWIIQTGPPVDFYFDLGSGILEKTPHILGPLTAAECGLQSFPRYATKSPQTVGNLLSQRRFRQIWYTPAPTPTPSRDPHRNYAIIWLKMLDGRKAGLISNPPMQKYTPFPLATSSIRR